MTDSFDTTNFNSGIYQKKLNDIDHDREIGQDTLLFGVPTSTALINGSLGSDAGKKLLNRFTGVTDEDIDALTSGDGQRIVSHILNRTSQPANIEPNNIYEDPIDHMDTETNPFISDPSSADDQETGTEMMTNEEREQQNMSENIEEPDDLGGDLMDDQGREDLSHESNFDNMTSDSTEGAEGAEGAEVAEGAEEAGEIGGLGLDAGEIASGVGAVAGIAGLAASAVEGLKDVFESKPKPSNAVPQMGV